MTYGMNVFSGSKVTLTSQAPLMLLSGASTYGIGPVSFTVASMVPPLVFINCSNPDIAWSVPRIVRTNDTTWAVSFQPLPYLLSRSGLNSSAGATGQFRVAVFGSKDAPAIGYGGIMNTANLSAGPLATDRVLHLDLNAAGETGLPVTSDSGRTMFVPEIQDSMICTNLGRNAYRGDFFVNALGTKHPTTGIPLGFGTPHNMVTSFQGYRDSADQPRQYDSYWDIMLINMHKYL